jgi:hypothetical protein
MVRQVLHEHATTLSASGRANRSSRLIKCAKDSGHYRQGRGTERFAADAASERYSVLRARPLTRGSGAGGLEPLIRIRGISQASRPSGPAASAVPNKFSRRPLLRRHDRRRLHRRSARNRTVFSRTVRRSASYSAMALRPSRSRSSFLNSASARSWFRSWA